MMAPNLPMKEERRHAINVLSLVILSEHYHYILERHINASYEGFATSGGTEYTTGTGNSSFALDLEWTFQFPKTIPIPIITK